MAALKNVISDLKTVDELLATLAETGFRGLSSGDITAAHRRLKKLITAPGFGIAYLGNHTLEPLPDYVAVRCACNGIVTDSFIGAYNQYFQEVLEQNSGLTAFAPKLILLSLSMRELAPRTFYEFLVLSDADQESEFQKIIEHLEQWVAAAKRATDALILICNFPVPAYSHAGIADLKIPNGETEFYLRLNLELLRRFRQDSRVHVLDLERLVARYGKDRAHDPKMYYLARMEWHEGLLPTIADEMGRYVNALTKGARKCLVLDLDNTMWGGVLGEDGVDGIRVGNDGAEEQAYRAFQQYVRVLKDQGVILAVASKNNYEDVREVFETRTDMPLKLDDFSVLEINWNNKHESLIKIARELNIGTDSLVFVDDSPAECALIRQMLPEVKVVQLAGDPAGHADELRRMALFDKLEITAEDRDKTEQYRNDRKRSTLQATMGNLSDYLHSLGTEVVIRAPTHRDVGRVYQLFNKTNQFNVTTKRYSPANVEGFMTDATYDLRIVDVKDRFGDLGTVGVVLIERGSDTAKIDSFVLSCRAMGRDVETAIMNTVKRDYMEARVTTSLLASYLPTRKNKPVENLYESQGFSIVESTATGEKHYRLEADKAALIPCAHITVIEKA